MPTPTITNVSAVMDLLKALQNADEISLTINSGHTPPQANARPRRSDIQRDVLRGLLNKLFQEDPTLAHRGRRDELRRLVDGALSDVSAGQIGAMIRHMNMSALEHQQDGGLFEPS